MHREIFILTSSYSLSIRAHSLERHIHNYHNYHKVQLLEILYYTFNFWHHKMWSAKYIWCAFMNNLTVVVSTSLLHTIFVLLTWNYINPRHSSLTKVRESTCLLQNTIFLPCGNHSKTVFSILRKNSHWNSCNLNNR